MEFCEKLQELRKQKGLTQEELAKELFVSRTAIAKWESGRGYPNIDSLKAVAVFFGTTVDELLSTNELLIVAEEDGRQQEKHTRDLLFGLLDCSLAIFFFLPFFGEKTDGIVYSVSLLSLTAVSSWLKVIYLVIVAVTIVWGVATLALQNCQKATWIRLKSTVSLLVNGVATLLFIISQQPYAAAFLFTHLLIKVFFLIKTQRHEK